MPPKACQWRTPGVYSDRKWAVSVLGRILLQYYSSTEEHVKLRTINNFQETQGHWIVFFLIQWQEFQYVRLWIFGNINVRYMKKQSQEYYYSFFFLETLSF